MQKVYNSLTFEKEEFKTIKPNEVSMYVCGPTVYDSPHLGHAKSAVTFDLIRRYLEFKKYNVKLVKNYTDIDDKIIKRANEKGIGFNELSEHYIEEYEEIMDILNIEKDFKNPRATETIDFMIDFIQGLIDKGNAYERNGSVYFSVKTYPDYKKIFQKGKILEEEEEEEEETPENYEHMYEEDKLDPKDFALWKKSKEGEPFWESPWGKGRPGWHIECSAMAINYLGETIDVHGGGQDLKFPHHRNECAQSISFTGKPFANFFIHNGFVNVDNEKMSKSLGNFFLVSDVVKEYDPMVVRLFLITSHYRSSVNYSLDNMNQAKKNYFKILNAIKKVRDAPIIETSSSDNEKLLSDIDNIELQIMEAMDDDFNTPIAIAALLSLVRNLNKAILQENIGVTQDFKDKFFEFISKIDKIFGIKLMQNSIDLRLDSMDEKDEWIKNLLEVITETRNKLRERKIFDISDELRDRLKKLGIDVEDNKI